MLDQRNFSPLPLKVTAFLSEAGLDTTGVGVDVYPMGNQEGIEELQEGQQRQTQKTAVAM